MEIKIKSLSKHQLPEYSTSQSAGMDIRASIDAPIVLKPLERKLISTGLYLAIPDGYEVQIRPRSGLALKYGISVLNSPGTIDADYRGEIGIVLVNLSGDEFVVNDGDRIAQMVVAKYEQASWKVVAELDETERSTGEFGHTGNK